MKYLLLVLCTLGLIGYLSGSVIVSAPIGDEKINYDFDDGLDFPSNFEKKNSLLKDTDTDEKDDVLKLSNFALRTLDKLDPDNMQRVLLDIIDSKKGFVNGIMYHLTLLVALTKKDSVTENQGHDDVDVIEKNICKINVLRTWATSESLENAQVVGSQCIPERRIIYKRSAEAKKSSIVGGKESIPIDRDDIKRAANLGLQQALVMNGGSPDEKVVVTIISAKTQVVAGILYEIEMEICDAGEKSSCETCTITSVEQAWLNEFKVISSDCKSVNKEKSKVKRSIAGKLYYDNFLYFMQRYNKSYNTNDEKERRYRIFRGNMKKIQYLQETEQGTGIYGITEFADLTRSEFKKYHLGFNPSLRSESVGNIPNAEIPDISIPEEFDWRKQDVVTPVKNQGFCGSCWAFSVTGNIEGQYAIKHKKLVSFSEQELVDCDKLDDGCSGGYMTNAYEAIEKLGGLESENDYPYEGYNKKCAFVKNETVAQVIKYVNISSNETKIAQWLVQHGPISIGINANAMQFYFGGVSHPLKFLCNPNNLDHGVLLVGYGIYKTRFTHKSVPYWLIKNSWGDKWGSKGYYLLYRGSGVCGVNTSASSAFVE